MNETAHRRLMQLSATSRVATADMSDFAPDSSIGTDRDQPMPLSDMLEMSLEALLSQFRRK
jgi:hypothetical protein